MDHRKVGDFGLATSSLAAVEPSELVPHAIVADAEMTLGSFVLVSHVGDSHHVGRGWHQIVHRTGSTITKKGAEKSYQGRPV
jgi:hypothetical protein